MDNQDYNLEKQHINNIKSAIEKQLDWGSSDNWKQRDFENLSHLIEEKTNINISLSTLKRLWKNQFNRIPHQSSLDAYAQFAGYKNWNDYKQKNKLENTDNKVKLRRPESKSKPISLFRILIYAIFILGAFVIIRFVQEAPARNDLIVNYNTATFSCKKDISRGLPNTVIFEYDISQTNADSAFIQQSWDIRRRQVLATNGTNHSSVYYFPGYHNAKLIVNDSVVKQHNIHIATDGWLGMVRYSLNDEIPMYLDKEGIFPDSRMFVSRDYITKQNIDIFSKDFVVSFYYVDDFKTLESTDYILETEIKNSEKDGALVCQYGYIFIMCEKGRHFIPLCQDGCVGNISLKFGENRLVAANTDLSYFGRNMNRWQKLNCTVKDNKASVSLNDEEPFEVTFRHSLGKVVGIQYSFTGCGSVNSVKLSNSKGEVFIEDDFEGKDK